VQPYRVEVKIRKYPAYFPVFSLDQHYPDGLLPKPFDVLGPVEDPVDGYPPAKSVQDLIRYGTGRFHQVFLFDARPGMPHGRGEFPVIGKQDKPRGTVIQTAYGIEPFPNLPGEQIRRQIPPLGIAGAANIQGGFMEGQIPETAFRTYHPPVKANLVARGHLFALAGHDTAVYRNPPLGDDFFRSPAGGCPGMGQVYL
jgi:hypothetical protein